MTNRQEAALALSVFFATALIVVGYEFKDSIPQASGLIQVLSILAGLFLGPQLAHLTVRLCFTSRSVRRLILGKAWIEGAWLLGVYLEGKHAATGVLQLSHDPVTGEVQAHVYYPQSVRGGGPYYSTSSSILFRERDLLYMNYFVGSTSGGDVAGVAVGHFLPDSASRLTTRYEGRIFWVDGGPPARHLGFRLDDDAVTELIAGHGPDGWLDVAVERHAGRLRTHA